MDAQTNNRQRIVAAMSVLEDGQNAADLKDFMSEDDAGVHTDLVGSYSSEADCEYTMKRIVKHLVSAERFSSLADVHPAWILEKLRDEPPRVIGIILRFLPSQHVRYILKNLPPILCKQVPNMVESFSVPPAILNVIRSKFEKHFVPMRISRAIDRLGFENLYYLKEAELNTLFLDVGLTELAIALSGMSSRVLRIIYNRLDIKDAKRLKAMIDEISPDISPELFRQARANLLQIETERVGPKQLLKIIGMCAFADAVDGGHEELVRMVQQRLDPKDGYLLKRYVDEKRVRPSNISSEERRQMILDTVVLLAQEGRIDSAWGDMDDDLEPQILEQEVLETPSWDEETSTLQLA